MRAKHIPARTKFGRLTTTGEFEVNKHGQLAWMCVCECGTRRAVVGTHLRNGKTVACGCRRNGNRLTHGHARRHGRRSRSYTIWRGMVARCTKPSSNVYHLYGGRGICIKWPDFESFISDMGEPPSSTHSIDRIDPDGHYEAGNCRWATPTEQARNIRSVRARVVLNGERMSVPAACERVGLPYSAVIQRVRAGWSDERAFSEPIREVRRA